MARHSAVALKFGCGRSRRVAPPHDPGRLWAKQTWRHHVTPPILRVHGPRREGSQSPLPSRRPLWSH